MLTKIFIISLLFIVEIFSINYNDKFKCDRSSDNFKCRLTSITPYRFIANFNDSEIKFPDCEATKIWLIVRHGTRLPGKKVFKKFDRLEKIREEILKKCQSTCNLTEIQVEKFRSWEQKLRDGEEMLLTEEGENELIGLAERYQARFPKLMPENFDNKTFKFKFTPSQRTEESTKNFATGLFGREGSKSVWYPPTDKKDPILRFYKACEKWKKEVDENPKAYEEEEKFKNTELVLKMLENISTRIGMVVSFDDVRLIRDMCAFETAWSDKNESPWCDLLTLDEFKIVEFMHDLHYYWTDGYGFPLTYKQACTAARDMFKFFDSDDGARTTAYFTHSGTLLKLLSLFDIAKDSTPLRHDQFSTSNRRLWRTSIIDAFATNIAFIAFDCKNRGKNILTMHQERIVNLPGCPENGLCPLSTMKDRYPDREDECEFEKMCSVDSKN